MANVITFLKETSEQISFLSGKLERLHSKNGQLRLSQEFLKIANAMKQMGKGLNSADMERQMAIIANSVKKSGNLIADTTKETGKKQIAATKYTNKQMEAADDVSFKRRINKLTSFTHQAVNFFKMQMLWYPTKALSFKLLAVPGNIIRSTAEYGDALLQVSSVARLLPGQLKELDDEIQKTAATTKFSITELGEATKQLAQAGFQKDEIKAAIRPISLLATATASSVQSSTDLIATIVRAYGKSASDVADITDTLAAAVTKSRLTIDKLNDAFNYVASAAAQANVSFEDTTAMLGILANSGMKMTTAATGLRMSFLKLLAPTQKASNELKKFGLSDEDVNLTKHNIYEVLKTIQSLPVESVIKIFSARSATAILALNNVGVDGIKLMRKAMDAHGLAATMAKEQLLGLKQSWKNLLDVITSTEYKFGTLFGDALALHIRTIRSYFLSLGEAIENSHKGLRLFYFWISKIVGVLAAFSIAKSIGGGLFATQAVAGMSKALGSTNKLKKAVLMLKAAFTGTSLTYVSKTAAMTDAAKTAGNAFIKTAANTSKSILSLFNPWTVAITAVIVGLGLIIKHYYDLRKNSEKLISDTAKYNVEITKIKGNLYDIQAKGLNLKLIKEEDAEFYEKYLASLKQDLLDQITLAKKAAEAIGAPINLTEYNKLTAKIRELTGLEKGGFPKAAEEAQNFLSTLENVTAISNFISKLKELAIAQKDASTEGRYSEATDAFDAQLYFTDTGSTVEGGVASFDATVALDEFNLAIAEYRKKAGSKIEDAFKSIDKKYQIEIEKLAAESGKSLKVFFQRELGKTADSMTNTVMELTGNVKAAMTTLKHAITDAGDNHAWTAMAIKAITEPFDQRLKALRAQLKTDTVEYKELKAKRDALIESLLEAPDQNALSKQVSETISAMKAAQKPLLEGIVGLNTALEAKLKFGISIDDIYLKAVAEIQSEIVRMQGKDFDTTNLQKQLADLKASYASLFGTMETKGVKASEEVHKEFLKLIKDSVEVAKANGFIDVAVKGITIKYAALIKVINDQIAANIVLAEKEGDVNGEIAKTNEMLEERKKQLKLLEAFEKIEAKSAFYQKELKAQKEIYDLLGKTYKSRKEAIKINQEQLKVISEKLAKEKDMGPALASQLKKEKEVLKIKIERLEQQDKESSGIEGFVEQIKILGEEYEQVGITYQDGVELANSLNEKFASGIEDNFMALVNGTKSFTQAFKDSFKTILHDFYQMMMQMAAKKVIVPVVMSAVGIVGSGVASAFGGGGFAGGGSAGGFNPISGLASGAAHLGSWYTGSMGSLQSSVAGMLPGSPAGAGIVYPPGGSGMQGFVGGMSPAAFGGLTAGIGSFLYTGFSSGDWGRAAGRGVTTGLGAWGGGALGGMAAGAMSGATWGSILPGIGTVIGAVLGSIVGSKLFGKASHEPHMGINVGFAQGADGWLGQGIETYNPQYYDGDAYSRSQKFGVPYYGAGHLRGSGTIPFNEFNTAITEVIDGFLDNVNALGEALPDSMSGAFTTAMDSIFEDYFFETKYHGKHPEDWVEGAFEKLGLSLDEAFGPTVELFAALNVAVANVIPGFGELINTLSQTISNYFSPLLAVDEMLAEAGGTDYRFEHLVDQADSLKLLFDNAVANDSASAWNLGQQYAAALVTLDPYAANLELADEIAIIQQKMLEVGGSPEDFQTSILTTLESFRTGAQESINAITTAITELHPEINLDIDVDMQIDDTGTHYDATVQRSAA